MRLVYGVGINDATYKVTKYVCGKKVVCKAYDAWTSMLERCYSDSYQKRNPTYVGVTVCDEWLSFMAFRRWYAANYVAGWQLDKDLLGDARVYGPESCICIPSWLNKFTIDCGSARGEFPIGVSFCKNQGKFHSYCRDTFSGKKIHLGTFYSPIDAHAAWLEKKLEMALARKREMDDIDPRIYKRVCKIIELAA